MHFLGLEALSTTTRTAALVLGVGDVVGTCCSGFSSLWGVIRAGRFGFRDFYTHIPNIGGSTRLNVTYMVYTHQGLPADATRLMAISRLRRVPGELYPYLFNGWCWCPGIQGGVLLPVDACAALVLRVQPLLLLPPQVAFLSFVACGCSI